MVGLVLVSHSRSLAQATKQLVRSMTGPGLPLAIAAGVGDNRAELGTDAVEISEAITSVMGDEGVLVLMDMGSALLSSDTALEFLDEPVRAKVRFCAAPFVEGAVAAGVTANQGAALPDVYAEALAALKHKEVALGPGKEAAPASPSEQPAETHPEAWQTLRVKMPNPHGLHARPAARLINEVHPFQATITLRNLSNQRGPVSAKSLSSLASLEILHDNEIEIAASGPDALAALKKMGELISSGLGDELPDPKAAAAPAAKRADSQRNADNQPIPVSDGIAVGRAVLLQRIKPDIPQDLIDDVPAEIRRLRNAIEQAQETLELRREHMSLAAGAANAGIYEAQILALQDPELVESAVQTIETEKANAALAWNKATQRIGARYQALQDPYLRERAADLEDVGWQVLDLLLDHKSGKVTLTEPGILLADDLSPFQISSLPKEHVQGVILLDGGPTAHSSILLKALGIPTVVQARGAFADRDLDDVKSVALDGATGHIWLEPDEKLKAELLDRLHRQRDREKAEQEASAEPGATLDGARCEIFANIGSAAEAREALHSGAEGIGLLRTEFLFLDRDTAPTEAEQVEALQAIAVAMGSKPIIVRTLDAGGDKKLPYLHLAPEENPFLGVRAVRLCFSHEELFASQLRAILRAGYGHDFRIMFPMIATVSDLDRAKAALFQAHASLEKEGIPHLWPVPTGIMIEIPSAALQAELLAQQVDFFSIGTNDLTQYTLAADRGNPLLQSYQDALHPSVLRLIQAVVTGARQHGRPVAVCGEAASDETAAILLVGLGVTELSMTGSKIPRIKATLRRYKLADLQAQAQKALQCRSAAEVRQLSRP